MNLKSHLSFVAAIVSAFCVAIVFGKLSYEAFKATGMPDILYAVLSLVGTVCFAIFTYVYIEFIRIK